VETRLVIRWPVEGFVKGDDFTLTQRKKWYEKSLELDARVVRYHQEEAAKVPIIFPGNERETY